MDMPKAFARLGVAHLEAAVLEVMGDGPLEAWEISKRLGIPAYAERNQAYAEQNQWHYAIVHGILRKLQAEGRVERDPNHAVGEHWRRIDIGV